MRRVLFILLLVFVVVLAGCQINLVEPGEDAEVAEVFPAVDVADIPVVEPTAPVEIPVIAVPSVDSQDGTMEKYYFNASWECLDGYLGRFDGFGRSCKSEDTWMHYAVADCGSRCSGGCGVREMQPVEKCGTQESDSYLLQQGKQVTISFDEFFIIVQLRKVYLNGKIEIDVDFGDELIQNTTLEPRKTFKHRNVSITSNKQFYNREQPEGSSAEFLIGGLVQPSIPLGTSACSLVKNRICPLGCLPAEDYDCCEAVGRCWVESGCGFCAEVSVLKGDWNGNGDVDDPDLDYFLKVLDSKKGAGQNAKGYTYDRIFDFDDDGDVDNEDYIAFDAAFRKK